MNEQHDQEASISADVSVRRIAHVYAESLLNAAQQKGDSVLEELDSLLDDVFKGHPQFETLLSSAVVGQYVRRDALEKAFAGRASETFLSFLHVLNRHERLELLRPIRHAAHEIDDERKGRLRVQVLSAVALPDGIRSLLIERIRQIYQKEPVLDAKIRPELLGGLKIRVLDRQVDATVSNYLDNMKKYFFERSSHEIQSRRDRFSSADGN